MHHGSCVCVYDGEHRPFRSYTLHLSLGLSPVWADGGRLSRQTLLSCSFSSTLRAAFFRGTEPVFLICKFPSTMEHGQSHGIVVVLPVSAATAVPTVSLSVALKDAVELAPGPAGDPGRRPAHALDDRCQPGNPPTDDSGGPSGKGVPSATAEARPLL